MAETFLLFWGLVVGGLFGGKAATEGKLIVRAGKADAPKVAYLRPCVGAQTACDR